MVKKAKKENKENSEKRAYDIVKLARDKDRPTSMAYINQLFRGFLPLAGDRRFAEDRAVVGGIAWFGDIACTVIGLEKGVETKDKIRCNFGSAHPEGYRKALRLMKQAEKFHRPVICFVDTAGAYCGIGAEERGQGQAIAENLMEMMTLKTPILSILIGEGGSGGALALAVADEVWMMENAIYSVITPEGCASILWKDPSKNAQAAECLKLTAKNLLELGVIEKIIPFGFETRDSKTIYPEFPPEKPAVFGPLESEIRQFLEKQTELPPNLLIRKRYHRFRMIGA